MLVVDVAVAVDTLYFFSFTVPWYVLFSRRVLACLPQTAAFCHFWALGASSFSSIRVASLASVFIGAVRSRPVNAAAWKRAYIIMPSSYPF